MHHPELTIYSSRKMPLIGDKRFNKFAASVGDLWKSFVAAASRGPHLNLDPLVVDSKTRTANRGVASQEHEH
jgi:hypothetical protein